MTRSTPDVDLVALAARIEELYDKPTSELDDAAAATVDQILGLLDEGHIRVASPGAHGLDADPVMGADWTSNEWAKKAILLAFATRKMEPIEVGPYAYHDKLALKGDFARRNVRVVPPATARYGSYLAPGVVLMPSYVNIGAYVGAGTMVDTWATVGSCAQIGADVHLSGGVGIGGVLEPLQATPVIVEDGAFIGSRCIVVEGVRVGREAVLGANVVLTASTPIIDVRGKKPVELRGKVPPRAIVIPGTRKKKFPAGKFRVPCALIVGERSAGTDLKTSLNAALREHAVSV
jgi:2,3,4,5-tetrahydropyridine-2-carboxylate N-succinyltransferase